MKLIKCEV